VVPARGYKRESRFIAMHLFTTFLWNKSLYNSSHLSKNYLATECFTTNCCPNRTQMTLKTLHNVMSVMLSVLRKGVVLSLRESLNRRQDVWLHLASLKEIPSEETWKLFIMFSFRKDYSLTQREEF